jgi:cytochrome c551
MGRGWRPLLVGATVVVLTFVLARAAVFAPSTPAGAPTAGDAARGAAVFRRECATCHGDDGQGGGVGPRLAGSGLDAEAVATAVREGRGVMPAGLVSGDDEADVVAYVVSVSSPGQ